MNMRISGLATGLDTDQTIKDLMKASRLPLQKLEQDRQKVEWQREAYKEVQSKIVDFRNNKLSQFRLESTLLSKTAALSGNTAAVTASARADAISGTIEISVTNRAVAATNRSASDIRINSNFNPDNPLSNEMEDGTITSINLATNNTITLNGKEIAIESGDSLNDIIKKINKQTNVTAFYDSFTGRMSLVSKQTGEVNGTSGTDSTISIAGALFTDTLKITQGSAQETAGANANLVINNIATERTSNSFTVNGVNITLNEASAGKSTTIEVKTDTDAIVNSIKTFIKDYNELNTLLSNKLGEQKFRDFLPLTEEQKENMSDKEVELWEGKAKSGLLRNDSILERTYNRLRTTLSSYVDNGFNINSLSDLGITTGFYQERGKLNLADEGKLRAAIENNVEAVYSVFASSSDPDGSGNGLGVVTRMYNELKNTLSDIADKAGTSTFADLPGFNSNARLSRRIGDIDKQIDTMNERLKDMEDRYYKQFTAMEQAIQRFNAQSSYLMGQFGAGG